QLLGAHPRGFLFIVNPERVMEKICASSPDVGIGQIVDRTRSQIDLGIQAAKIDGDKCRLSEWPNVMAPVILREAIELALRVVNVVRRLAVLRHAADLL